MTRYVQHISGKGERWALCMDGRTCNEDMAHPSWVVSKDPTDYSYTFILPKSEYIECEPPVKYERVKACVCPDGNLYFEQEEIEVPEGYKFVLDGEAIYLERQVKG